ncbi:MAG TPA: hypothetical protein DHU65_03855 [Clostridiales bacterium]|nr:hypothetical protein [Clostridiales bacterium]
MAWSLVIAGVTAVMIILSVLFFPEIKIGKIKLGSYWIVALIGAAFMLILNIVSVEEVIKEITADTAVNPLKILALFLSMTLFSVYLDELGFFSYLSEKVLVVAKNSQKKLFLCLYLTVSVLTVFTSNDIIILTFTPFICAFCKRSGIDPKPYLFSEFVAANTWSMALLIGNPTNIYIGGSSGLTFFGYFSVMILPTIASGTVSFLILYLLFKKSLCKKAEIDNVKTAEIKDKFLLYIGLAALISCIILLAVSSYINIESWIICVSLFVVELLITVIYLVVKRRGAGFILSVIKRAPYELIPFILSMFVIVSSLKSSGATGLLKSFLDGFDEIFSYGISSFLCSNLINNIPMSVLFSTVTVSAKSTYATIIGSNLGAIFTPVGALAGIMWSGLLKKNGIKFSFRNFIVYGATVSVPSLITCLAVLGLVL